MENDSIIGSQTRFVMEMLAPSIDSLRFSNIEEDAFEVRMAEYNVIVADTCFLLSPSFPLFFLRYADKLMACGRTLRILPHVKRELESKAADFSNIELAHHAQAVLQAMKSQDYGQLFQPTRSKVSLKMIADMAIYDYVTHFGHLSNQLVLTCDKQLAASVYNFFCEKETSKKSTIALTLDGEGRLACYLNLAVVRSDVLPTWCNHIPSFSLSYRRRGDTSSRPSYIRKEAFRTMRSEQRYTALNHAKEVQMSSVELNLDFVLTNAVLVMDESQLKFLFAAGKKQNFIKRWEDRGVKASGKRIHVSSASLRDAAIEDAVKALPDIFLVHNAVNPTASEETALLHLIFTLLSKEATVKGQEHIRLLTRNKQLYRNILLRRPTCYESSRLLSSPILSEGYLGTMFTPAPRPYCA